MAAVGQPKAEKAEAKVRMDPSGGGDLFGPLSMTNLQNRDPGKHYVFVAQNRLALAEYRQMGYRPEVGREGGVTVAGEDPQDGKDVEAFGHVLMSVSAERHRQIEQQGAFGSGGQKRVDALENAIIDRRAVQDNFRGPARRNGSAYFRVRNETEDLVEETDNG